jgi:mRNA interferase RelE/StbE
VKYHVELSAGAKKQLSKIDRQVSAVVIAWIRKNLEGCENPRRIGKPLRANRSGQWRYRIGDYRLIAEIQDARVVVLIIEIGHRREIYES